MDGRDPKAELATLRLSELVFEALGVLKATNGAKALHASLKRGPLGRLLHTRGGGYTISPGQPVWMLTPSADAVGITEDGGLGVTDDGELVVTSAWLNVRGELPIDPHSATYRRTRQRVAAYVRKRGFDSAVSISGPIQAFGEPQVEWRFRGSAFRNVFYLDGFGNLVFGSPDWSVDAAQWFGAVLGMAGADRTFFDNFRSKTRAAVINTGPALECEVGVDDQKRSDGDTGPRTGRLSLDAEMVAVVARAMGGADTGQAVLFNGRVSVPQLRHVDPGEAGRSAGSLFDVLPVMVRSQATSGYSHWVKPRRDLRESLGIGGADTDVSFDDRVIRVDKRLEMLAHSNSVSDCAWLRDPAELEQWLAYEMIFRLRSAIEAKIVDDISKVDAVPTVRYDTSPLVSIRKGLTHLPVADWPTAAVVLHPIDWETIELTVVPTNDGVMPLDPAARMLFGCPVIISTAAVAGQAVILGRDALGLSIDGRGVQVKWSGTEGSDVPELAVEIQGNYQTDVYRPFAVIRVLLAQ